MADVDVTQLLNDERLNAILAWVLVATLSVVALATFLDGDFIWAGFAAAFLLVVLVPPLTFLSPQTMLPWEILLLAGLPILGRAVATFRVSSQVATCLSVAALALIVAVELNTFTSVRMTSTFAIVFVTLTTMATAGVWAVVRWSLDTRSGRRSCSNPA